MAGSIFMLYKREFAVSDELPLKRFLTVLCGVYVLVLSTIYVNSPKAFHLAHFAILLLFCPLIFLTVKIWTKFGQDGTLNLLLVSVLLSMVGLLTQYRMNLRSKGLLASSLGLTDGIPTALSHFIFSIVAISGVSFLLFSGNIGKVIDVIEKRTGTLFWGFVSSFFLIIPYAIGNPVGGTLSWLSYRSIQPSEFVFKISFIIFLAKFFSNRSLDFSDKMNPTSKLLKIAGSLIILAGAFFFVPLVFLQKEFGTALMIGLTLIIMLTVSTGRWYFLAFGIVTIVVAMSCAVLMSDRIEERIVGGYLMWQEYAFKEYFEGSENWPGNQSFKALSAVNNSGIWGTGLVKGMPRLAHVTNDYISVPIMEELGIIGLIVLIAGYLLFVKETCRFPIMPDFKGYLLVGMPLTILCQAFYNLSGVLGLFAFTGIPLPFVSNGGSATISNYLTVGIISALLDRIRLDNSQYFQQ